jgi:E3 ubiquitin-protein ligase HUWE1
LYSQLESFLAGFHDILPADFLTHFDARELELLICGLPNIDIEDLRAHTTYSGYTQQSKVIKWLWSVLRQFSDPEKALFLQFVTGTSKVPLGGKTTVMLTRAINECFFSQCLLPLYE